MELPRDSSSEKETQFYRKALLATLPGYRQAAQQIIDHSEDIKHPRECSDIAFLGVSKASEFTLPGFATLDQTMIATIEDLLKRCCEYKRDKSRRRPYNVLMIAEPGSGKSHFVDCITKKLEMKAVVGNLAAGDPNLTIASVVNEARNIANLPQYLDQRLVRLVIDIERIDYIRNSINAVRNDLPDGAVKAEKKSESHGRQPALVS